MHFAMPPRKTSRPPPYAARTQPSSVGVPPALKNLVRSKPRALVAGVLGVLALLWLLSGRGSRSGSVGVDIPHVAVGSGPPVVIVTTIDPSADAVWVGKIKANRDEYAKRHGYLTFFPSTDKYPLNNSPATWSRVPALRHAMTLYPGSTFFWFLDSSALIMSPSTPIHRALLTPAAIESNMRTNTPVVPPDSVIKTFANLKGERIDLILAQDAEGLASSSFVIRNGDWAKYFLDAWFDPIYRSYNFQKAEAHALEHIVQWHGTVLAKLALVPQALLNSYVSGDPSEGGRYEEGALVANFLGCATSPDGCRTVHQPFFDRLASAGA